MRGAAIECRIYAEDPANNFFPSSGADHASERAGGSGSAGGFGHLSGLDGSARITIRCSRS